MGYFNNHTYTHIYISCYRVSSKIYVRDDPWNWVFIQYFFDKENPRLILQFGVVWLQTKRVILILFQNSDSQSGGSRSTFRWRVAR